MLRKHVDTESVDLIYLDPPFNSAKNYNLLFNEEDGTKAAAQRLVFGDTWVWNSESAALFEDLIRGGGRVADVLEAFRTFLGHSTMLAYLTMMAPRLIELRRVLKKTGSVYLHCDQTASHYLKLLMDSVFSPACFRNEIIWSYRRWPSPAKHFQRMHDTLLFYSKDANGPETFNVLYEANSESYTKRFKGKTQVLDPETKTRKLTVDAPSKGLPMRDVWDIKIIAGSGKERLGYPTQKPEVLLDRILTVSAAKGAVVLDPFCGCGTTVAVAQRLGLPWIGIDITHRAIAVISIVLAQPQILNLMVIPRPSAMYEPLQQQIHSSFNAGRWDFFMGFLRSLRKVQIEASMAVLHFMTSQQAVAQSTSSSLLNLESRTLNMSDRYLG